ncbi:MAG: hypothetical protein HC831_08320 [Chloroflexia bacterium]|nr:hypothetical protein [Chloroflexia bacterium]
MSITVRAVPKISGANPPGLVMVLVIFADTIISMEEYLLNGQLAENPVLIEGSEVYTFFTSDLGASYDHSIEHDNAGELHKHKVSINYASPEELADPILRRFSQPGIRAAHYQFPWPALPDRHQGDAFEVPGAEKYRSGKRHIRL